VGRGMRTINQIAKLAVIIPAYRVANTIQQVISSIAENVDHIIVVDDHCPEGSGKAAEKLKHNRLTVIYHPNNTGVGGAVVTGYEKALDLGCDICVKMDGDGQMDAHYLNDLIAPLTGGEEDYAKGNRFMNFYALKSMPKLRLFGNSILSFLLKAASGYWNIMDPTNGYTAIHKRVLVKLPLRNLSKGYFFESDMLIHLNIINAVVKDVNIPAKYTDGKSSLQIMRALIQFPPRLLAGFLKRFFLKYYIYDFNMASVYVLLGVPLFLFGIIYGLVEWLDSLLNHSVKPAGTIMLVALPIIVSFQMLLQAINIDIQSIPQKRESRSENG